MGHGPCRDKATADEVAANKDSAVKASADEVAANKAAAAKATSDKAAAKSGAAKAAAAKNAADKASNAKATATDQAATDKASTDMDVTSDEGELPTRPVVQRPGQGVTTPRTVVHRPVLAVTLPPEPLPPAHVLAANAAAKRDGFVIEIIAADEAPDKELSFTGRVTAVQSIRRVEWTRTPSKTAHAFVQNFTFTQMKASMDFARWTVTDPAMQGNYRALRLYEVVRVARIRSIKEQAKGHNKVHNFTISLSDDSSIHFETTEFAQNSTLPWITIPNVNVPAPLLPPVHLPPQSHLPAPSPLNLLCCAKPEHGTSCANLGFIHATCESCDTLLNHPTQAAGDICPKGPLKGQQHYPDG